MKTVQMVPNVQPLSSVQSVPPRKKSPIPSFPKRILFRSDLEIAASHGWPASSLILYTLSVQDPPCSWHSPAKNVFVPFLAELPRFDNSQNVKMINCENR